MELNRKVMKQLMLLIAFAIVIYSALKYFDLILTLLNHALNLLSPFILGLVIAFILSVPMRFFERFFVLRCKLKKSFSRVLSMVIAVLFVIGILSLIVFIILPELASTLGSLASLISDALEGGQVWLTQLLVKNPEFVRIIRELETYLEQWEDNIITFLQDSAGNLAEYVFHLIVGLFSSIFNFCLGFVFALYLLFQKEKLGRQLKRLIYTYGKPRLADRFYSVMGLSNRIFSNFLSGQCLEACILGALIFIGMSIFNLPYALLIGTMTAIMALIPMFGALISCALGALLILIDSPIQALIFVIVFIVIQQIEGNLIYPRVVGNSVGLPPIWVLLAVMVGGGIFGIPGMLIFIPLFSVIYTLLREGMQNRIRTRHIHLPPDALEEPPPGAGEGPKDK